MVRRLTFLCLIVLLGTTLSAQSVRTPTSDGSHRPDGPSQLPFSLSPPVREMPPQAHTPGPRKNIPLLRPPLRKGAGNIADPVVQTFTPTAAAAAQSLGQWEGLGAGYPGFSVTAVPPDTNMAVGPNHVVQWVNGGFVVFDKRGTPIGAPVADSTFWASATCNQLGGFSDPTIQYDRMADRWIVGEVGLPLLPGLFGQFAQCFAVSTTSDPTGSYFMWGYGFGSNINDYPKMAVWPDGYYITWNIFAGSGTFVGPEACAWDRNGMLAGVAAPSFVCFKLNAAFSSLLPSDLDGTTPPPAGSPNFVMDIDPVSSTLNLWQFHVDYANPNNSTFVGPTSIAGVAPFEAPCPTTEDCISQPGTATKLDALGDRLMYRLAYRSFGDHASLVANHTVMTPTGNTGVRWYEVRDPGGTPTIFQQGTFAPDADSRWMGSIAMDKSGNIGVGYSVGSSATFPSIRFTGWEVGGPLGELEAETSAAAGGGSQTGYDRWGDYSAMRIDPVDDCTFWYTQEYQATTQSADWSSRIISFQFPSCGHSLVPTTTALASSPNPSSVGDNVLFTATVSPSAATGTVQFFDGASSLGIATLSGGTVSLSTSTLSAGSHSITAVYGGDATSAGSVSSVLTQNVNGIAIGTATSLASSPNPSTFGQSVALTAVVSPMTGTGTPTGSVTFAEGATVLGSSTLDATGRATISTSSLTAGTHSLTARYNGDSTYSGSSSAPVSQTVNKANTTTTVASSRNPSTVGRSVTFTAAVTPVNATGVMQFFDGAALIGTATLSHGTATLTTSSLSIGSHSITAGYGGDVNDNGSTSSVLTQTVNGRK
jgi:Big-like domain-containing protein